MVTVKSGRLLRRFILTATSMLINACAPSEPGNAGGERVEKFAQTPAGAYWKNLVIIDDSVLQSKETESLIHPWNFHKVVGDLATHYGADTEAFFQQWASRWEVEQTCNGDVAAKWPKTAKAFRDAWNGNRITLIGITNRIDLAKLETSPSNPEFVAPLGEGRFIYELTNANGQPLPFTIIVEFALPPVINGNPVTDMRAALTQWANDWSMLGTTDAASYPAELAALTGRFAKPEHLLRIRTSESINGTAWEFRQFEMAPNPACEQHTTDIVSGLNQVPLPFTPRDAYKSFRSETQPTYDFPTLRAFLLPYNDEILQKDVSYAMTEEWKNMLGAKATRRWSWTGHDMGTGDEYRALNTIALNTCNGCHLEHNSEESKHIFTNATTLKTEVSASLSQEVDLGFNPPGCGSGVSLAWCDGKEHWNERLRREYLLNCYTGDLAVCLQTLGSGNPVTTTFSEPGPRYH